VRENRKVQGTRGRNPKDGGEGSLYRREKPVWRVIGGSRTGSKSPDNKKTSNP